jgi:hypothetical protein
MAKIRQTAVDRVTAGIPRVKRNNEGELGGQAGPGTFFYQIVRADASISNGPGWLVRLAPICYNPAPRRDAHLMFPQPTDVDGTQ